jgi:hypothetical protein
MFAGYTVRLGLPFPANVARSVTHALNLQRHSQQWDIRLFVGWQVKGFFVVFP